MRLRYGLVAAFLMVAIWSPSQAGTTKCAPVTVNAGSSHNWLSSLAADCTFGTSQPAVGDLQAVGGDTVLANPTTSSAVPTATTTPVLGIAGTSTGTLGLSNSAGGTVTLQGGNGAVTNYTLDFPTAAPSVSGQALTATTGGVGSWTTLLAGKTTVVSKTSNYTVTSADDGTCFDNGGASGEVDFTLPASPSAGDEWCFTVTAVQIVKVIANTGQTITWGNTTSASAGNLQSGNGNAVGSTIARVYFATTTTAYAQGVSGAWTVN